MFSKTASAPLTDDVPLGPIAEGERLLGLQLKLEPFHPDLRIGYKLMQKGLGETAPGSDGTAAKTVDKRRSVVGVAVWLEGPLASQKSVRYAVKTKGKAQWLEAADGGWAGSAIATKGGTVEGVRVWV
jgi:hypothetical protein